MRRFKVGDKVQKVNGEPYVYTVIQLTGEETRNLSYIIKQDNSNSQGEYVFEEDVFPFEEN